MNVVYIHPLRSENIVREYRTAHEIYTLTIIFSVTSLQQICDGPIGWVFKTKREEGGGDGGLNSIL